MRYETSLKISRHYDDKIKIVGKLDSCSWNCTTSQLNKNSNSPRLAEVPFWLHDPHARSQYVVTCVNWVYIPSAESYFFLNRCCSIAYLPEAKFPSNQLTLKFLKTFCSCCLSNELSFSISNLHHIQIILRRLQNLSRQQFIFSASKLF